MDILKKIGLTCIAMLIGAVIFGAVKDTFGSGHHIIAALLVYILYKIWTRKEVKIDDA